MKVRLSILVCCLISFPFICWYAGNWYAAGTVDPVKLAEYGMNDDFLYVNEWRPDMITGIKDKTIDTQTILTKSDYPLSHLDPKGMVPYIYRFDREQQPILFYLIRQDNRELANLLFDIGADYKYRDRMGNTVLHLIKDPALLEKIIRDIMSIYPNGEYVPPEQQWGIRYGVPSVGPYTNGIKKDASYTMTEEGVDIFKIKNQYNKNPLHTASNVEVARILKSQYGIGGSIPLNNGLRLSVLATAKNRQIAEELYTHEYDFKDFFRLAENPDVIDYVCERLQKENKLGFYKKDNLFDNKDQTFPSIDKVRVLLKYGFNREQFLTKLFYYGRDYPNPSAVLNELLKEDLDLSDRPKLILALCYSIHSETSQLISILSQSGNLNIRDSDKYGNNVLHYTIHSSLRHFRPDICNELISNLISLGADPLKENQFGLRPIDYQFYTKKESYHRKPLQSIYIFSGRSAAFSSYCGGSGRKKHFMDSFYEPIGVYRLPDIRYHVPIQNLTDKKIDYKLERLKPACMHEEIKNRAKKYGIQYHISPFKVTFYEKGTIPNSLKVPMYDLDTKGYLKKEDLINQLHFYTLTDTKNTVKTFNDLFKLIPKKIKVKHQLSDETLNYSFSNEELFIDAYNQKYLITLLDFMCTAKGLSFDFKDDELNIYKP